VNRHFCLMPSIFDTIVRRGVYNISCKVQAVCFEQVLFLSADKSFILYIQKIATISNPVAFKKDSQHHYKGIFFVSILYLVKSFLWVDG